MHRALATVAGVVAIMLAAAPAEAGYGSIAYDQVTGKHGASFDRATPAEANEAALRQCASPQCRVHPVEPKGCGALAMSDKGNAWGGADRDALDEAQRDAVLHCQSHSPDGNCTVRVSGCNK
jgi:hypothetical protein